MNNTISQEQILQWYSEDILENKFYHNVYQFTKAHGLTEQEFYKYFASLESIERFFFEYMGIKTIETLQLSEDYAQYLAKEKLLSFYYTFFGNLTANRSFVKTILKDKSLQSILNLKNLRYVFMRYIRTLDIKKLDLKQETINTLQNKAIEEAAWIQFLSIFKFWLNDESPAFEKTDIFIEKSLNTSFNLINIEGLKSAADFGKFLFKEIKPEI